MNEQIRVIDEVKRKLEYRRREGESFDDVLERVLDDDRDLLAGFGAFEDADRGEAMRAVRRRTADDTRERIDAP